MFHHNTIYLKQVAWFRSQYTLKKQFLQLNPNDQVQELFKNRNFLIVNKPFDMRMFDYQTRNIDQNINKTLYGIIKDKYPFYYDTRLLGGYHVLHRLDTITSGCVCIPLNYFSQRLGFEEFKARRVEKTYLALVYGKMIPNEKNEILIDVPIGDNKNEYKFSRCALFDLNGYKNADCINNENAITQIRVIEHGTYKGKDCTKILLKPITGKRHQLRVHLNYLGYPVVGDMVYGKQDYDSYRTMLHSFTFKLNLNLKKKKTIKATAPDPFVTEIDRDWIPLTKINDIKDFVN